MTDPQNPAGADDAPAQGAPQPGANVPPPPPAYQPPAPPAAPEQPAQAPYGAPPSAYESAPPAQYGAPAQTTTEPGKTLGIVALVVVFFASVIGLILGYVARSQSKKAGVKNTPAKVAIILGWIFTVLAIIGTIIAIVFFVTIGTTAYMELCEGMPAGEYELTTGDIITCP